MKVLVAEDEEILRDILKLSLENYGFEIILAKDGLEAWEILQKEKIQIVLLDWQMPKKTGIEVCSLIRNSSMGTNIYIILLTSMGSKSEIISGFEAGADDYIVKPYDLKELCYRLKNGERIIELENSLKSQIENISKVNREMQDNLDSAAKVQKSLLPKPIAKSDVIDAHWFYEACEKIGGDMFNFFRLDESHIGCYILDVSGHGISAALLSVSLRHTLLPQSGSSSIMKRYINKPPYYEIIPPNEVLATLNKQFYSQSEVMQYFTIIYGIINITTKEFTFARAGHPYPFICTNNIVRTLNKSSGIPVGLMESSEYDLEKLKLSKEDSIYLYTDGVIEATDEKDVPFGKEKLINILESDKYPSIQEKVNKVFDDLQVFSHKIYADDISLIGFKLL